MLSIPRMWNLERNISGFELESILIIIFCGLIVIEKEKGGSQKWKVKKRCYILSIFLTSSPGREKIHNSAGSED